MRPQSVRGWCGGEKRWKTLEKRRRADWRSNPGQTRVKPHGDYLSALASGTRATKTFGRLIAIIARCFDTNVRGRAAFAARAIRRARTGDAERAFAPAKTRAAQHIGIQARHSRAVGLILAVSGNEVARSDAARNVARFASNIARAIATNAIRTEKRRRAILNFVALFTFGASRAPITATIDVRFIAILLAIRARETQVRFAIADFSLCCAIGVGIAFDALALAVTRIATTRVASRSLR